MAARSLLTLSQNNWFNPSKPIYSIGLIIYVALIIAFAYFYTSITFNPIEVADNMKKQGGFIPGIRPGKPTSDYLNKILNYIVLIGALGLTIVVLIPIFFNGVFRSICIIWRNFHYHYRWCSAGDNQTDRISDGSSQL